jgi:hypothetical protein
MRKIKTWVIYVALGALLTLGVSAVPTASGHRSAAAKKAEARHDVRLTHKAAKDAKKDAADEATETKLVGLTPAMETPEEQTDEENENLDEQEENEDEQDEDEQTAEEDLQEEGEEAEEGIQDGQDELGEAGSN